MNQDQLLVLYRKMVELRCLDEMLLELKMKGLIMDGFHPYQGQEAVALGIGTAIRPEDVVISNHRPQGHAFSKGTTSRQIMAEFLGRRGGPSQGIGGPMQFIDVDNSFFCGSIVGSGITFATGVAMALKRAGKDRIAVTYFGDGASNTGSFHEGLNLASIWKLPVLFILENNQYGEAMPVREFVSVYPISKRAESYSMPGITVDGMDVITVAEAAQTAVGKVRRGEGPYLLEAVTYRFKGHYGGDPEHTYRTREEVEQWRQKDPLPRLKALLIDSGVEVGAMAAMENEVSEALQNDQAWALEQPFLTVEEATDHVMIPLNSHIPKERRS
jgi:TPP-dependent pyruvate/acetoin dehydrogenase alpha subunit